MTSKLRCVIVDDEQGAIEVLSAFIKKVSWLELAAAFSDPLDALNYLSNEPSDLVFMDINMPDLDGMQLSRLIKNIGPDIVFCTAYPEHAVESYEIQALDYLLKPIPFERFLAAANKAQNKKSPADITLPKNSDDDGHSHIFIKSGTQIHQVDVEKISFIKKDGHYIVFKVNGRELLSRMTFSELLELLPANDFIQVHRSYIVAIKKIEVIQKQFIQIEGKEIPIGDSYKKEFFQRVNFIGN
ncbi:MAG: LytTR family DNA-binding domain-containing protein [Candidatus Marinimicrobia bacterium]|nr:LytTR family DNA-binding domain-containing protein [Candidatus Neomarinimicrobiota bacterium]MCF7922390.1 LytTR family DNA-binding domain-containing protein [Candidatus Neomarinimicrobiota bacterium]